MKEYEVYGDLKVPVNSKIILRLDGRSFHSLAKNLNLEKPYDEDFARLMVKVSKDLFNEFAPVFIYTFSDEISILLDNIPFNGRIEKINSVAKDSLEGLDAALSAFMNSMGIKPSGTAELSALTQSIQGNNTSIFLLILAPVIFINILNGDRMKPGETA